MTKSQYEELAWCETKFGMVRKSGYVHITRKELDKFLVTYEKVFGETLNKSQRACPRCVVRAMTRMADEWYRYREKAEKRKKKDGEGEQPADA